MYIRTQNKNQLINFDNFHIVSLDEEERQINAIHISGEKKIIVPLGTFEDLETARHEYEEILDSLLDEEIGTYEVE